MSPLSLSPRTIRLSGALALALILVGSAYVLSGPSFFSLKFAGAGSNEELLRSYAAKDTDHDGLPDWQEELYGTDPNVADTDGDGISDGEAATSGLLTTQRLITDKTLKPVDVDSLPGTTPAPGTLTEEFSRTFFESYMGTWKGTPLSKEEQDALIQRLLAEFSDKASIKLASTYTANDVTVDGAMNVTAYAARVESAMRANDVAEGEESPILLTQSFIENGDASALPKLARLSNAYAGMARAFAATPVPPQLRDAHLALIRSLDTLAKSTDTIAEYESDPLAVLGALSLLQPAANDFVSANKIIAEEILRTDVPASGTPGALIVNIANSTSI